VGNLGAKELLYLILPLAISLLIGVYTSNFIQDFASRKIEDYTSSMKIGIKIPTGIRRFVQRREFYYESEILNALDAIDLRIPKQKTRENLPPPPKYELTFIYIGMKGRYAIINGLIVKEGDYLSSEERVVKIEKDRVLLDGKWGKRWIYLGE